MINKPIKSQAFVRFFIGALPRSNTDGLFVQIGAAGLFAVRGTLLPSLTRRDHYVARVKSQIPNSKFQIPN